jgi:hypothetical protein
MFFASIPFFLNLVIIIAAWIRYERADILTQELLVFVLYSFPLYYIALSVVIEKKLLVLISSFKWIGLIATPYFVYFSIYVMYHAAIGTADWGSTLLGDIVYLAVAYSALMISFFCLAEIFYRHHFHEAGLIGARKWINLIVLFASTAAFVSAGSRGALIAYIIMLGLFFITSATKKLRYVTMMRLILCLGCLMAVLTIAQGGNRYMYAIEDISNGDLYTALNSIISAELAEEIRTRMEETGMTLKEVLEQLKLEYSDNPELLQAIYAITDRSTGRVYFYRLALTEASSHPFTGIGPFGYHMKYTTYPHNLFLETAADFGFITMALQILFFLSMFIYFIKRFLKDARNLIFLGFLLLSGTKAMLSVDLYNEPYLIFISTVFLVMLAQDRFTQLPTTNRNSTRYPICRCLLRRKFFRKFSRCRPSSPML